MGHTHPLTYTRDRVHLYKHTRHGFTWPRMARSSSSPQGIIDKLAATVPAMFENGRVTGKMKAGGSPMHVMTRDEVLEMWAAREVTLKELLAGL